jgi:2-polyprenyl-3-methyl-5-hydroxy-6-metoxy-1,4-benzoquinol methylase
MGTEEERKRLKETAEIYRTEAGRVNRDINSRNLVDLMRQLNLPKGRALQLGLGDGYVAQGVSDLFECLLVVEGSQEVIDEAYDPEDGYQVVHSLFEDYHSQQPFDVLLGNHVLEHVDDPVAVLRQIGKSLKPGAVGLLTVPNADSLHRRIGVQMGLLKQRNELHGQDLQLGHRRVYNIAELESDVRAGGFRVIRSGGYMVKLVSNRQMADWPAELLEAIFQVSLDLPAEICSNLAVLCEYQGDR